MAIKCIGEGLQDLGGDFRNHMGHDRRSFLDLRGLLSREVAGAGTAESRDEDERGDGLHDVSSVTCHVPSNFTVAQLGPPSLPVPGILADSVEPGLLMTFSISGQVI